MIPILELLASFVFEGVSYAVGRIFLLVFFPRWRVEPWRRDRSVRQWQWARFSYVSDGHRYVRMQSVELVGIAVLVVCIATIVAMVRS